MTGAPGASRITVLGCVDGRSVASIGLDSPLAAPPVLDPDRQALYLVTRSGQLRRHALPGLALQASATLAFEPTALAVAGGADAIVLAGGRGAAPLTAHEPATLAELQRYAQRDGLPVTVSALMDNPGRRGFVVGFEELPEAWEIVYDRDAPPVLLGFVHDYRNREAVPLPGRLTARPFKLATPTRSFAIGPVPWEIARIDAAGALGVINLEVRREIERPPVVAPQAARRVAAWRAPGGPDPGDAGAARDRITRGWVSVAPGSSELVPMRAVGWRPLPPIRFDGEVLAMTPTPRDSGVLVAHRGGDSIVVSAVDPSSGAIGRIAIVPTTGTAPADGLRPGRPVTSEATELRFVQGTGTGCVALVDGEGRWLAGFGAPAASGEGRGERR